MGLDKQIMGMSLVLSVLLMYNLKLRIVIINDGRVRSMKNKMVFNYDTYSIKHFQMYTMSDRS